MFIVVTIIKDDSFLSSLAFTLLQARYTGTDMSALLHNVGLNILSKVVNCVHLWKKIGNEDKPLQEGFTRGDQSLFWLQVLIPGPPCRYPLLQENQHSEL